MNVVGGTAAAVISIALGAIGLASPAGADDFSGTYTIDMDGNTATWTVTPCDTDSVAPCVRVAQVGGEMQPWQAEGHLGVGYWTMFADRPDTISCDDGSKHPGRATYSWDAVTLSGFLGVNDAGICGGDPRSLSAPFTLTKIGAAEIVPAGTPPAEPAPAERAPAETPPVDTAPGNVPEFAAE